MKKQILELGKKHGLKLHVESNKFAFDIIDYDVNIDRFCGHFIGVYRHMTGKTSTGVTYPTESILIDIEKDLVKYLEFKSE
jgi:hypothetical protein